jgi:hypothetical protein
MYVTITDYVVQYVPSCADYLKVWEPQSPGTRAGLGPWDNRGKANSPPPPGT